METAVCGNKLPVRASREGRSHDDDSEHHHQDVLAILAFIAFYVIPQFTD